MSATLCFHASVICPMDCLFSVYSPIVLPTHFPSRAASFVWEEHDVVTVGMDLRDSHLLHLFVFLFLKWVV